MRRLSDIDPEFGHWFAGFTDGESHLELRGATRNPWCVVPRFTISQRWDDGILDVIQAELGIGKIYTDTYVGTRNARPCRRWYVGDKQGLLFLVKVLDRFPLRGRKAAEFVLWRAAVVRYAQRRNSTVRVSAEDIHYMATLKATLELIRLVPKFPTEGSK